MKTFMIINGSPRKDGISAELVKQVKPYFLDCEIKEYNVYDLAPAPCTDCKYCEYHEGCSNHDLDIFFEDFEAADYVAFFTPVYNNFFPAPLKAVIDRFQRYFNARYKRGANPPVEKRKKVGVVISSRPEFTKSIRNIRLKRLRWAEPLKEILLCRSRAAQRLFAILPHKPLQKIGNRAAAV